MPGLIWVVPGLIWLVPNWFLVVFGFSIISVRTSQYYSDYRILRWLWVSLDSSSFLLISNELTLKICLCLWVGGYFILKGDKTKHLAAILDGVHILLEVKAFSNMLTDSKNLKVYMKFSIY